MVLLYDRVFLSKSWREVLRRRWGLYAGLAATWTLVLVMLPYGAEGTAVFGRQGQAFEYALAECGAIAHYLRLCFWPHPLLLDYGPYEPQRIGQAIPFVLLIGGLLLATAMAFRWQPWLGFLGVWFFAILAPSSSIVPLFQQIVAEKRMYLPLAAVVTGVVIGVFLAGQWLVGRRATGRSALPAVGRSLVALVGLALGILAFQRNADYHSDLSIWQDTVNKFPANARALSNFGAALFSRGQIDEAIARYQEALAIKPDHFEAHNNLGDALVKRGQIDAAIAHYQKAVAIKPDSALAHDNLGNALADGGRIGEAIAHYQQAIEIQPD